MFFAVIFQLKSTFIFRRSTAEQLKRCECAGLPPSELPEKYRNCLAAPLPAHRRGADVCFVNTGLNDAGGQSNNGFLMVLTSLRMCEDKETHRESGSKKEKKRKEQTGNRGSSSVQEMMIALREVRSCVGNKLAKRSHPPPPPIKRNERL